MVKSVLKSDYIVETFDLTKIYHLGKTKIQAVNKVNLTIEKGEILALMGSSGGGKSTLLHLIGGILDQTSGRIISCGLPISEVSEDELSEYRRKKVGFVFQFKNLSPVLTAAENIELPLRILNISREERKRKSKELLTWVNMECRADHPPFALSGGEQQRLAVLIALASDPELILADEPTGELDSDNSKMITNLLKNINKEFGKTIILVTHDPSVAKVADRVLEMRDGKIIGRKSLNIFASFCSKCESLHDKEVFFCSNCGALL
jgi:putative ABC transport system ATP-binding protein